MKLLKGYEGFWIKLRRNNGWYLFNKILSISIGIAFAVITIMFKRTTQVYMVQEIRLNEQAKEAWIASSVNGNHTVGNFKEKYEAYHILTIYWFLFIYFSLAAMDELIEAFSVINQMEKGALGLFFELNYIIGLFLTVYITWFVNTWPDAPVAPTMSTDLKTAEMKKNFTNMYGWLYINYCYLFFCVFMSMVVACIYKSMDSKAKQINKVSA